MLAFATALTTVLLLPGFSPLAPGPAGGQVLQGTFPGTQRPGLVYLPPQFDPTSRYPVAYLLHGMPGSPSEYLGGTQLAQFADAAVEGGQIKPFIAVIPAAGPDRNYNGEWAGEWEQALVRLVPWIDARLPTIRARGARVLAGLSAGGFGAADIGLRHPELFGTIESWSGYFTPLHDGPFKGASRAVLDAHDPTQLVLTEERRLWRFGTRFYLSTGPFHSHWFKPAATIAFGKELHAVGLPHTVRVFADRHGEWQEQLDDGLLWALGSP